MSLLLQIEVPLRIILTLLSSPFLSPSWLLFAGAALGGDEPCKP
jgi:hypothetical protein